jgi:rhamnogalacturonyl hydrolase YesR
MAEVNDAELTTIENAFEAIIQALSDNDTPEAVQLKQMCVEAQQIVTAKIDQAVPGASDATGGPAGK